MILMDEEPGTTQAADGGPFKTHVHELVEQVARSPYRIAPEKKDELLALLNRRQAALHVEDGNQTAFRFEGIFGQVVTSIRSLQHIWAAACYYASLYCEREEASARGESEIPITWNPAIETVSAHYALSCKMFKDGQPMPWPPDIKMLTPNTEYLDLADVFFLDMCSFALLHEIAHFELGHHEVAEAAAGETAHRDEHATELAADKWAYDWILSSWKEGGDDPKVFTKRLLGVIFTLAMTDEFRHLAMDDAFSTHPTAVDRLIQLYDDYEGEIKNNDAERTCFLAMQLGLQMVAFNNKGLLPAGPYDGIRGFLQTVKASQKSQAHDGEDTHHDQ